MIKIAICEDEKETQILIEDYLNNILKNINVEYEIQKYISGEELLECNLKDIDILLLDIQMGQINGMDTARKIREVDNKMEIIFITSLIDYVQEGYEVRAYRYLLKPIELEELKQHVLTCINEIENKNNHIIIKNKSNTYKIYSDEIKYVEVQKKEYVNTHNQ
ncbi:response regulator [Clostridium sp. CCUG 7971]|uniref:LytR/AlgR family response regulator transcription factor n=1 Tax=Clostridium sp. CCUG 7971 TaxID=2811414 RepID=UPI002570281F|nr:response regulator [Clostridium sp. CCUG 7971]